MTLTLPLEPFLSTPCQPVCAAFACRVCGGGGAGGPCRGSCRLTCICVLLLLDSTSHGGWPRRVVKRGGILREHASLHTARHYTRHICITAHRLRRPQRWTALGQKRKPPRPAGTCGCTCSRAWQPSTPVTRPRRARACWCGRLPGACQAAGVCLSACGLHERALLSVRLALPSTMRLPELPSAGRRMTASACQLALGKRQKTS